MRFDERHRAIGGAGRRYGIGHPQQRAEYKRRERLAGTQQPVRGAVEASVGGLLCPEIVRSPRERAALTRPRARGCGRRRQQKGAAVNAHDRP
jgi:hypothetical protein